MNRQNSTPAMRQEEAAKLLAALKGAADSEVFDETDEDQPASKKVATKTQPNAKSKLAKPSNIKRKASMPAPKSQIPLSPHSKGRRPSDSALNDRRKSVGKSTAKATPSKLPEFKSKAQKEREWLEERKKARQQEKEEEKKTKSKPQKPKPKKESSNKSSGSNGGEAKKTHSRKEEKSNQEKKEEKDVKEDPEIETAVTKIQSGKKVRADYQQQKLEKEEEGAVLKIQSMYRGKKARKNYEEMKKGSGGDSEEEGAVLKIQSMYRGKRARKNYEEMKKGSGGDSEEEGAVLKIQSMYRGKKARKNYEEMKKGSGGDSEEEGAVLKIQSMYRGKKARKNYEEMKKGSGGDSEEEGAVLKIQSMYRGKKVRKNYEEMKKGSGGDSEEEGAVLKIQSMYRGKKARKNYEEMKKGSGKSPHRKLVPSDEVSDWLECAVVTASTLLNRPDMSVMSAEKLRAKSSLSVAADWENVAEPPKIWDILTSQGSGVFHSHLLDGLPPPISYTDPSTPTSLNTSLSNISLKTPKQQQKVMPKVKEKKEPEIRTEQSKVEKAEDRIKNEIITEALRRRSSEIPVPSSNPKHEIADLRRRSESPIAKAQLVRRGSQIAGMKKPTVSGYARETRKKVQRELEKELQSNLTEIEEKVSSTLSRKDAVERNSERLLGLTKALQVSRELTMKKKAEKKEELNKSAAYKGNSEYANIPSRIPSFSPKKKKTDSVFAGLIPVNQVLNALQSGSLKVSKEVEEEAKGNSAPPYYAVMVPPGLSAEEAATDGSVKIKAMNSEMDLKALMKSSGGLPTEPKPKAHNTHKEEAGEPRKLEKPPTGKPVSRNMLAKQYADSLKHRKDVEEVNPTRGYGARSKGEGRLGMDRRPKPAPLAGVRDRGESRASDVIPLNHEYENYDEVDELMDEYEAYEAPRNGRGKFQRPGRAAAPGMRQSSYTQLPNQHAPGRRARGGAAAPPVPPLWTPHREPPGRKVKNANGQLVRRNTDLWKDTNAGGVGGYGPSAAAGMGGYAPPARGGGRDVIRAGSTKNLPAQRRPVPPPEQIIDWEDPYDLDAEFEEGYYAPNLSPPKKKVSNYGFRSAGPLAGKRRGGGRPMAPRPPPEPVYDEEYDDYDYGYAPRSHSAARHDNRMAMQQRGSRNVGRGSYGGRGAARARAPPTHYGGHGKTRGGRAGIIGGDGGYGVYESYDSYDGR